VDEAGAQQGEAVVDAVDFSDDAELVLEVGAVPAADELGDQPGRHSRFERQPGSSQAESDLYNDTAALLTDAGWPVCTIDITMRSAGEAAIIVTDRILALHADANQSSHEPVRPVPADVQHR
jgi:hypothetical protein